jgi:hypothetical protein
MCQRVNKKYQHTFVSEILLATAGSEKISKKANLKHYPSRLVNWLIASKYSQPFVSKP